MIIMFAMEGSGYTSLYVGVLSSLPYPHPYQYELDHFQPSYHQLRAVVPTVSLPIVLEFGLILILLLYFFNCFPTSNIRHDCN